MKIEPILIKVELDLDKFRNHKFNTNLMIKHLLLKDDWYQKYEKEKDITQPLKEIIFVCENSFFSYIKFFDEFSFYINNLNLKKIDKRTLNKNLKKIDELNTKILKNLVFFEKPNINDYIERKNNLKKLVLSITNDLDRILNLIFEDLYYKNDVSITDLKKLDYSQIEEGDILLLRKKKFLLSSFLKIISKLLDSSIIHSSIVYKKYNGQIYVFEADAFNNRKLKINKLKENPNYFYIVLRNKKKLTLKQKKNLKKLEDSFVGSEYSVMKIVGAFFERHKEKLFENSNLPLFRKTNPFKKFNGIFCSEIVSKIYGKIGINLGLTDDDSIVSPLDILNSPELKIVGYMNNENNKIRDN